MDREKIDKAAFDYVQPLPFGVGFHDLDIERAFRAGAEWRINSVWHDGSEEPEANKRVLVCFEEAIAKYTYYRIKAFKPNIIKNWQIKDCFLDKILRWAYIDDLLPDRKEVCND